MSRHPRLTWLAAASAMATALFALADGAAAHPTAQPAPAIDLVELIDTPGVSGYEEGVRALLLAALPVWAAPHVDSSGNLIVTLGSGTPHLLIAATSDESGYVISDVDEQGYARLHRQTPATGTLFDQFFYGQPIMVQTGTGSLVAGVSATVSTHISRDGPPSVGKVRTLNDLVVDLGARSRDEVHGLGVRLMDPVALRERVQSLAGARVAGVGAQVRAGAAALQLLLAGLAEPPSVEGTVTLAWTAEGLSGYRGLGRLARELVPDRAIVVSPGLGISIQEPRGQLGQIGEGALVRREDDWLVSLAGSAGVAISAVDDDNLRSPAGATRSWRDTAVHQTALPTRYIGSPVEMISAHDVDTLARLLAAAAELPAPTLQAADALGATLPPATPEIEMTGNAGALERLIETYGPSGHESPVRKVVLAELPDWAQPTVDAAGNVLVSFGSGDAHQLFVAHMDEVGYEVAEIRDDGTLALRRLGGFIEAVYEASPAYVHGAGGAIAGLFAPRDGYLQATDAEPARNSGVRVDLGTDDRAASEALGVRVGDPVTVRKRLVPLAGTRATGRSIDDRVGSTALLLMLRRLDPESLTDRRVTVAWSTEEEVGLVGARAIAESTRPDIVFAVDTFVSSDSPVDWQRRARIPLGSGLVARVLDNNHVSPRATVDRVLAIAARHGIPITPGSTGGGTDAGAFVPWGAVPMPISWPARYSHSPVETMDTRDLDWLVEFLVALATEY